MDDLEHLPEAERDVLAALHRTGATTAREIRGELAEYRPMAHGSVLTLLKRLEEKGLVGRKKGKTGKAYVYKATQQARPFYRRILGGMVERVFGGDGVALVASLLDTKPPTPEELARLEAVLKQYRGGAAKKGEHHD